MDREIHLSVEHLQELIERAPNRNYMLVQDSKGEWVRIVPVAHPGGERP